MKSPAKAAKESPGKLICVGTGKIGWELCALADLPELKRTIERQAVHRAFLSKAKAFMSKVPNCKFHY